MVREAVVICGLFAAPLAAQDGPWENYRNMEDVAWSFTSSTLTYCYATSDDLTRGDPNKLTRGYPNKIWVRCDHSEDKTVPYRSSLWLYHYDCDGRSGTAAVTAYNADGSVHSQFDDALPRMTAIRPNTMGQNLEAAICD